VLQRQLELLSEGTAERMDNAEDIEMAQLADPGGLSAVHRSSSQHAAGNAANNGSVRP
jgi:hypothetical protein